MMVLRNAASFSLAFLALFAAGTAAALDEERVEDFARSPHAVAVRLGDATIVASDGSVDGSDPPILTVENDPRARAWMEERVGMRRPETSHVSDPAAALAAGSVASIAAGGLQGSLSSFFRIGPIGRFYSRIERSRILAHPLREDLYDQIRTNPGVTFSQLLRHTSVSNGVLVHHLMILERHQMIRTRKEGTARRFFITGERLPEPQLPLSPAQSRFLTMLKNVGPVTRQRAATHLAITEQAAGHHMRTLRKRGLVTIDEVNGRRVCRLQETPSVVANLPPASPSGRVSA